MRKSSIKMEQHPEGACLGLGVRKAEKQPSQGAVERGDEKKGVSGKKKRQHVQRPRGSQELGKVKELKESQCAGSVVVRGSRGPVI